MPVLYTLSSLSYVILYKLIGYRRRVVDVNLRKAFPDKNPEALAKIRREFYRNLCDIIVESLKNVTISESAVRRRVQFRNISLLEGYYGAGQSVMVVLGHLGNWEFCGARIGIEPLHETYVIYRPLKNKHFNRLVVRTRRRFGNKLYHIKSAYRAIERNRDKVTLTAFLADQAPFPRNAHWFEFLHQDTPFFAGPANLAHKLRYPVIYASVKRTSRGHYSIEFEMITEDPSTVSKRSLTERYVRLLERDIKADPSSWLWTHRRWKHERWKPKSERT